MTAIISCITKNKNIFIYSDQRTIDDDNNILSDRTKKILQINNYCTLAFTGYVEECNELLTYLYKTYPERMQWEPKLIFDEALKYEIEHPSEHTIEVLFAGYINKDPIYI